MRQLPTCNVVSRHGKFIFLLSDVFSPPEAIHHLTNFNIVAVPNTCVTPEAAENNFRDSFTSGEPSHANWIWRLHGSGNPREETEGEQMSTSSVCTTR